MKIFVFATCVFLTTAALCAEPMSRVVAIRSSRVLTIQRNGVLSDITLGQIAVAPADEEAAIGYLTRTLRFAWVLVETSPDGLSYVYRSPDALFVNGELARRAYAAPAPMMTYLGESPWQDGTSTRKVVAKEAPVPKKTPVPKTPRVTVRSRQRKK